MITDRPEWAGKVEGLMINQSGAEDGLGMCGDVTTLPIGQDNELKTVEATLGAGYNSFTVVNGDQCVAIVTGKSFPDVEADLVKIVENLWDP